MKLLYLVLNRAVEAWKRPPRERCEAKPQFAILFGDRFVVLCTKPTSGTKLLIGPGLALDSDPRRVAKSGPAQDAAQLAAIEIAATGAAAPASPPRQQG